MLIRNYFCVSYKIITKNNEITNYNKQACFSRLFHFENLKNIEYVDVDLIKQDHDYNHFILLDKEKIIEFLKYLKTIVRFEFNLEELDKKYILHVKLIDKKRLQIMFLFTCIRKLFEFPYNIALYDWFQLYKKRWKRIQKLTLLYFLDYCCCDNIHGLCCRNNRVIRIDKLKLQKYLKTKNLPLQSFLTYDISFKIIKTLRRLDFGTYAYQVNSEELITEESFKTRLNIYNNIFKALKNENICR